MKVGIIDFLDSFTYNLVHYLEDAGADVHVFQDDQFEIEELDAVDKIILSPGPGLPHEKKSFTAVLDRFQSTKPILGVCLGMQGIAAYFGAKLYNLPNVCHGFSSDIQQNESSPLYLGLPKSFSVARYHSWAVKIESQHPLIVDAQTTDGIIMSFHHSKLPIFGVQYHPESILTDYGKKIIHNFLQIRHSDSSLAG